MSAWTIPINYPSLPTFIQSNYKNDNELEYIKLVYFKFLIHSDYVRY